MIKKGLSYYRQQMEHGINEFKKYLDPGVYLDENESDVEEGDDYEGEDYEGEDYEGEDYEGEDYEGEDYEGDEETESEGDDRDLADVIGCNWE